MDEVEAALDDVNLHRFLGLVAQFRDDAQLLIVSHQKRQWRQQIVFTESLWRLVVHHELLVNVLVTIRLLYRPNL